jgi:hypothetical protein
MLLAAVELLEAESPGPSKSKDGPELRPSEIVAVSLVAEEVRADGAGWAKAELQVRIRDGFHINTNKPPAAWLKPTEVRIEGLEGQPQFPEGTMDRYEGTIVLAVMIRGKGEFEVTLTCQPCDDQACYEVVEKRVQGRVR